MSRVVTENHIDTRSEGSTVICLAPYLSSENQLTIYLEAQEEILKLQLKLNGCQATEVVGRIDIF